MQTIILILIALGSAWTLFLAGGDSYPQRLFFVVVLFSMGYAAKLIYQKLRASNKAALLASALFMISVCPQPQRMSPAFYSGIMGLLFVLLGLRSPDLKPRVKASCIFLFLLLHALGIFVSSPLIKYLLPFAGNFLIFYVACFGIDSLSGLGTGTKAKIRKYLLGLFIIVALFYAPLVYFYEVRKIFFFIFALFNVLTAGLIALAYFYFLIQDPDKDGGSFFNKLFIATVIEALTVAVFL